ncbi:MAG: DUF86 domain-containing protein [Prevotella sp.]|nr:DUF86 domain-containing protein [Prevotella sp.]
MRERIRDIDRLHHIEECIDRVNEFLRGKTFEEMKSDIMCYHAVVYNIMVIGEAANLLTKEFRDEHPEVPWRDIVDMRNVLVHGYFTTSPLFIWETYTKDLGLLKQYVSEYIQNFSVE